MEAHGVCSPPATDVGERPRKREYDPSEFLRGLIEGMRCGILAVDRGGRLVMLNELGAQILGVDRLPPPGTPVMEALGEHRQVAQILIDSFTMTSLPNRAEIDLRPGTVDSKTIGFTVSLVRGRNDQPQGSAIFFKDLTKIEHKEEQERLRDRLAALGEMAAHMAHEIRNPLAAIEVTCSLLKRRAGSTGGSSEQLGKIVAEVRRLNEIVTSSLEFVKPLALDLATDDLTAVLEEAACVALERRAGPEVRFVKRYAETMPPFLMDRGQLRQVFENLLINAMEAVGTRGIVSMESRVLPAPSAMSVPYSRSESGVRDPWQNFEEFAVIRIADTGPGIAGERRDRIFHPFYTTKKQGSGVGLSMVKKIVNSHRGLIDVDDAPGGGALFTVRLPMVTGGDVEE